MKSVLIVDDAMFMRHAIRMALEKAGFEVVGEADNGALGAQMYQDLKPDLVTMDITMPDVDGIEGLKMIRSFDPQARVVMISAMGQETFVREAIVAGASGFLVKPFNEEKIIQVLRAL